MAQIAVDLAAKLESVTRACLLGIQRLGQEEFANSSGFVFEEKDDWFWITAGHSIEHFEHWFEEHGAIDFWFRSPVFPDSVTIEHSATRAVSLRTLAKEVEVAQPPQEEWQKELMSHFRSADVGVMLLPRTTIDNLKKLGCVPFTRDNVRLYDVEEVTSTDMDVTGPTVLVGLPGSSRIPIPSPESPTGFLKALLVEPFGEDALRMYFKPSWDEEDHIGSVAGMSGGPIVLLGWHIPIVLAIQSEEFHAQESEPHQGLTLIGFQFSKLLETMFPVLREMWQ